MARSHSRGNKKQLEASRGAECFGCSRAFAAKAVVDWRDEWVSPETNNRVPRWTALCPECGEPTVIGDASGLLEDQAFVAIVRHMLNEEGAAL